MKILKSPIRIISILAALALVVALTIVLWPDSTQAASGNWTKKNDTEIYWVKTASSDISNQALEDQIQLFAKELKEKLGYNLPISYGDKADAGANDIVLNLNTANGLSTQAYTIAASTTNVVISASDADGLFYGCRDLIKQILLNGKVTSKAKQAPTVLERGMSLDNGRKYFSVESIKELIRELSWANMNCLTLHFSEEMGLGIESKRYPWLAGRDGGLCTQGTVATDNRYLTQAELVDILNYAKLYHVEIIPSMDTPGHMNYIVKRFNEQCANQAFSFVLNGTTYTAAKGTDIGNYLHSGGNVQIVQGSGTTTYAKNHSRGIDISNEIAVAFTKSLLKEYADLFHKYGSTTIDIGGDELLGWGVGTDGQTIVNATKKWAMLDHWKAYAQNRAKAEGKSNWASAVAYDAFLYYMNDLNEFVRDECGYTSVRMWNDDALKSDITWNKVVELNTNIDILFWSPSNTVNTYINAGHKVINILDGYNYFAMVPSNSNTSNNGNLNGNYGGNNLVVGGLMLPSAQGIYNKWDPYVFSYTTAKPATLGANISTANKSAVIATALGVWCDKPDKQTEAEVLAELFPRIHAHGAKVWNPITSNSDSFATFTSKWNTMGAPPVGTAADTEIYVVADLTALQSAITQASTTDLTYRTQLTASAYSAAVQAGQAILNKQKPSQDEVDAAVQTISDAYAALAYPDPAPLQTLVDEYDTMDGSLYKLETFAIYTNAVKTARNFLDKDQGTYTEAELNAAITALNKAKAGLRLLGDDSGNQCFISGAFKADTIYVGKVATIDISVIKNAGLTGFVIYNDMGTDTEIFHQSISNYKDDRDNYTLMFYATNAMVGQRTYYIYGEYADGSLSSDCLELTVTIKN